MTVYFPDDFHNMIDIPVAQQVVKEADCGIYQQSPGSSRLHHYLNSFPFLSSSHSPRVFCMDAFVQKESKTGLH